MSLVEIEMPMEKCEAVAVRAKRWSVRALDYEQALLRSCRAKAREDGQQVDVGRSGLEQRHQQQEEAQVLDLANQPWQVEPEKQQVDEVELGKQRVDQQQESKQEQRKRGINSSSSKRYSGYNGTRCLSNNIQNKSKAGIDISSKDSSRNSNRFNSSNNGRKRN